MCCRPRGCSTSANFNDQPFYFVLLALLHDIKYSGVKTGSSYAQEVHHRDTWWDLLLGATLNSTPCSIHFIMLARFGLNAWNFLMSSVYYVSTQNSRFGTVSTTVIPVLRFRHFTFTRESEAIDPPWQPREHAPTTNTSFYWGSFYNRIHHMLKRRLVLMDHY